MGGFRGGLDCVDGWMDGWESGFTEVVESLLFKYGESILGDGFISIKER